MVLDLVLIIITFTALLIASYTDWKTREVPDWLNYGLIFSALGIRTIFSFKLGWDILLNGVLGFLVFFAISLFFYYSRQWGGGDSKLLMGMGAVIGITYPFDSSSFNMLWFFLALLFLGSIYGLIWLFYMAISKRKAFVKQFKSQFNNLNVHLGIGVLSIIIISLGLVQHFFWYFTLFPIATYYLFKFVSAVEASCFIKKTRINKLTEGDWLVKDVFVDGKKIMKKKTLEIKDLKKLYDFEEKIKHVTIKEGIPFVPSFLFAYVMLTFGSKFFEWLLGTLLF